MLTVPELQRAARTEYSRDMRQLVVGMHLDGRGYKNITGELSMPVSTVRYIVQKFKDHGIVGNLLRGGRPALATPRLRRLVVRKVLVQRRLSAETLAEELKKSHNLDVSPSTVRNIPHDVKLNGRAARKKPRISKINKAKRLKYAMDHLD